MVILDSGATVTINGDRLNFKNLRKCNIPVYCANGQKMVAHEKGTLVLKQGDKCLEIPDCLYIPDCVTLISAAQLTNVLKLKILLEENSISVYKSKEDIVNDNPIMITQKETSERLWHVPLAKRATHVKKKAKRQKVQINHLSGLFDILQDIDPEILHARYGHVSMVYLQKIFPFLKNKYKWDLCEACICNAPRDPYMKRYKLDDKGAIVHLCYTKGCKSCPLESHDEVKVLSINSTNVDKALSNIHYSPEEQGSRRFGRYFSSDTKECSTESVRGYQYLFVVVDRDTRVTYGFLGRNKDDFFPHIKSWLMNFYNKYKRLPAFWKFDQGGEFLNHDILDLFKKLGIQPKYSTTQQSNQNAISERRILLVWAVMKKMLAHSGVPMEFWCYAAMYAIFVINHVPTRALNFKTPLQQAKFMSHDDILLVFGSAVYYTLERMVGKDSMVSKLLGVILGISDIKMGYDILDVE